MSIKFIPFSKEWELTQKEAVDQLGIAQPDVSNMLGGHFRQFSVERLMRFLVKFGQDVEIIVRPAADTSKKRHAELTVTGRA